MGTPKQRVTVTMDPELLASAQRAVARGDAGSVSAWVSSALAERARKDQQLEHLRIAVADYERDHGEITTAEIVAQRQADQESATVAAKGRGTSKRSARSRPARRSA